MTDPVAAGNSPKTGQGREREPGICPFLGFEDDPETALAYPASYNFCYHCKPIAPVNVSHQRKYCLTPEHTRCRVYLNENREPLPKEYRGSRPPQNKSRRWLSLTLLLLVMVLVLIILSFLGFIRIPGFPTLLPDQIPTDTQTATSSLVTEPLPSATIESTKTPFPTITSNSTAIIPFIPHAIETPFSENPKLVIHQVQEGEGFILLAEKFGTTVEAIKAINYELPESLWVNTILVIPINTDDVTGLPQFSVREITTEGLTIEDYAQRMQLDAGILKQYNALPDGYLLKMGELIIIPN